MASKASSPTVNEKDGKKPSSSSSFLNRKEKADDRDFQPPESRSDDGTNTVATKTVHAGGQSKDDVKDSTALVPFFSLYRSHTKGELAMNFVGLICAISSGAAQVRPSAIFLDHLLIGLTAFNDPDVREAHDCFR
jgi:hypothetical protein